MDNDRSQLLPVRYNLTRLDRRADTNLLEIGRCQKEEPIFKLFAFCSSSLTCYRVSLLTVLIFYQIKYRFTCLVQIFI